MRDHLELAAGASVAASSVARWRRAFRRSGSSAPAGAWQTTRPGATKRAMLSMWPSVWSFFRPSSSQMTFFERRRPRPSAGFGLRLRPAVAVGVEQRLARRQDGALAVVVDRAALQHEVETAARPYRRCAQRRRRRSHRRAGRTCRPSCWSQSAGQRAPVRARENRAGVAQPDVAVACRHEVGDAAEGGARRGFGLGSVEQAGGPSSPRSSARTIAATSRRGVSRSPFHSSASAGQAVHTALSSAHSGGTVMVVSVTSGSISALDWRRSAINSGRSVRWGASYRALLSQ